MNTLTIETTTGAATLSAGALEIRNDIIQFKVSFTTGGVDSTTNVAQLGYSDLGLGVRLGSQAGRLLASSRLWEVSDGAICMSLVIGDESQKILASSVPVSVQVEVALSRSGYTDAKYYAACTAAIADSTTAATAAAAAAVAEHSDDMTAHAAAIAAAISGAVDCAIFCTGGPTTIVGSGAVSQNVGNFRVNTGETANSSSIVGYRDPIYGINDGVNSVNWAKEHMFRFYFYQNAASATSVCRVLFGKTQGGTMEVGQLSTKGYGFEVRNQRVWAVAHDGTTLSEVDTGIDYAFTTVEVRFIKSAAGAFTLLWGGTPFVVNGGPSVGTDTTIHFSGEVLNGATAATYQADVFQPCFRTY